MDLSTSLNCSAKPTFKSLQIMHYSTDANGFENDIPSDALDALADLAYEQHQAMMESAPTDYYKLHHELNNATTTG
jgi:hypothetical protein